MSIVPTKASRTYIVGKTKSGKSELARRILTMFGKCHIVIADPKGDFLWPYRAVVVHNLEELNENSTAPVIIIRPDAGQDLFQFWDTVCWWVWTRGNTVFYIDEVYLMKKQGSANTYPPHMTDLVTTGRTRGITFIAGSQRPSKIPSELMSEAEYYFCFQLKLPQDRKKMAEIADPKMITQQRGHHFWYVNDDMESAISMILNL